MKISHQLIMQLILKKLLFQIMVILKNLAIWDTAGQEKFHALAPMYYKDAVGAIIVYDITFKESFEKVQKWMMELKEFAQKKIILCIAGNKCDMEGQRQILKSEAESYAQANNAKHFNTSAKANIGIEDMFKYIATEIDNKQGNKNKLKLNNGGMKLQHEPATKKSTRRKENQQKRWMLLINNSISYLYDIIWFILQYINNNNNNKNCKLIKQFFFI
eukprot:TRINITY_DN5250_c0_g1_i2.p1 TRINITY_DN5250_c0_g1~~TRINITY_DN5250_c0_g1_i2.p1  ORF type:complete len:217 (-),score=40.32 TRINITY_DN5250_c0_g1_i2:275-925(-)